MHDHDIAEIVLQLALNTNQSINQLKCSPTHAMTVGQV